MSDNKMLNAVLAYIEGRPEDAREFLRSPEISNTNPSQISFRIHEALDLSNAKYARELFRSVLRKTMGLKSPEGSSLEETDAFISGVVKVEELLEESIFELDREGS